MAWRTDKLWYTCTMAYYLAEMTSWHICSREEQACLHIGSILNFPSLLLWLSHAGFAPSVSSISAWNIHKNPISTLCLPGLTFKGITFYIHIEKSCNNNCQCWRFKRPLRPDLHGQLQEQRIITFLQGLASKFATTSHTSSPFRK